MGGTFTNALQLLPIGRLDGGRILTCALPRFEASFVSMISTLLLFGYSLLHIEEATLPILTLFSIFAVGVEGRPELPCLENLTDVNKRSKLQALVGFACALAVIAPLPSVPVDPFTLL